MATLDLSGLDRLSRRFRALADPDATDLMVAFERIIDDDNRRGVLAGTDKDGQPMAPVTYRPAGPKKNRIRHAKRKRGEFQGLGAGSPTSAEYRRMTGPPLAPRGMGSRVITNLRFRFGKVTQNLWETVGYWDEVVDRRGRKFLHFLFDGQGRFGRIPARDLRGVRPEGVQKAKDAARAWVMDQVRTYG